TASKKTPASKSKPKSNTFNSTPTRSLIRAITETQAEPDLNLTGSGLTCTPDLKYRVSLYRQWGLPRASGKDSHIHRNEFPRYWIKYERRSFWEGYVETHSEIDLSASAEEQLNLEDSSNFIVVIQLKICQ